MRVTKKNRQTLLERAGAYVEETGDHNDPDKRWFWTMHVRGNKVTHCRKPYTRKADAWSALAKQHLAH